MKTGFIYIWRDKKHNRYYVGSHLGEENDSYVCSSSWMKQAYKHRPEDFKRRILKRNIPSNMLLDEEFKWLQMIGQSELGKKYYNMRNCRSNLWYQIDEKKLSVAEKISRSNTGQRRSDEQCKKMSEAQKGRTLSIEHREKIANTLRNQKQSEETKLKRSMSMMGRVVSEETRAKLSAASKRQVASLEARQKMSEAKKGRKLSDETKRKMSLAHKGKKYVRK